MMVIQRKEDRRKQRQKERMIARKKDRRERKKPIKSKKGTTVSEYKREKSVATSVRLYSQSSVKVKPLAAG